MNTQLDLTHVLPAVHVPTLVMHMTGDRVISVKAGRKTAQLIPGAQFVELPGNNHVVVEGQPSYDMFFEELRDFLSEHGPDR